jgi:hypothetical protein
MPVLPKDLAIYIGGLEESPHLGRLGRKSCSFGRKLRIGEICESLNEAYPKNINPVILFQNYG